MAFSQSIQKAQAPKTCELCLTDTNIKWRCQNCQSYMCEKCKNIHQRVQTTIEHKIIEIKTCGGLVDVQPTVICTDNIPCQIHKSKLCFMFCRSCDVLVCSNCISSSHKKHDLEPIDQVCMEKIEKLEEIEDKISQNLVRCESENKDLEKDDYMWDSMSVDAIKKIDARENKMKEEIGKYAQGLRDNIEKNNRKNKQLMSEKAKEIDKSKITLEDQQEKIQTAKKSTKAEIIFAAAKEHGGSVSDLSFTKLCPEIQEFVPGELNISKSFGILSSVKLSNKSHDTELKVLKSYTTDLSDFHRLVSLDKTTAWISSYKGKIIRKVVIDDKIQTIKEIPVQIYDMTLTKSNDILISTFNSSDVKLITQSGQIKPFLSVSPLITTGIHVTHNNDIMLGVMEKDTYKLTDKSCRKIIVFGENKKEKQSYQYNKHKQRLFTVPYRITDVNTDIAVIDRTSYDDGRVVVLGKEGGVKWIYQGHPQINTEDKPLDPRDIVTTLVGNIIVADYNNHTLHVISGEGELLTYKDMSDQGVIFPMSLHIDTWGQLWVGCSAYKGKSDAKVHIVKL